MVRRYSVATQALLIAAVALAPSGSSATFQAMGAGQSRTEVVFIGTHHTLPFWHPDYSPAHIRALLSRIAPAALCVELLPDWHREARIPTFPLEAYAAVTWARTHGVPVYGVNSLPLDVQFPFPVARMDEAIDLRNRGELYQRFQQLHRSAVVWQGTQAYGNSSNDLEVSQRRLPTTVTDWPQEDTLSAQRDDRIATNIRDVIKQHAGARIGVVYGAAHYLPLKRRLEGPDRVRVSPPGAFLPLEPARIQASWHADDPLLLLGTNLDDWQAIDAPQIRNHQRTKDLLERLSRERPGGVTTRYYEARWRMLFGDLTEARRLLEEIVRGGGATTVPYIADTRWSWPPFRTFEQKARFYLGVTHDLSGDHESAAKEYRALLDLPEDQLVVVGLPLRQIDLRPFLRSLISVPYEGGTIEVFRAFLANGR